MHCSYHFNKRKAEKYAHIIPGQTEIGTAQNIWEIVIDILTNVSIEIPLLI